MVLGPARLARCRSGEIDLARAAPGLRLALALRARAGRWPASTARSRGPMRIVIDRALGRPLAETLHGVEFREDDDGTTIVCTVALPLEARPRRRARDRHEGGHEPELRCRLIGAPPARAAQYRQCRGPPARSWAMSMTPSGGPSARLFGRARSRWSCPACAPRMASGGGITWRARHGGERLDAVAGGGAERTREDRAVDAQHGVLALLPEAEVAGDGPDVGERLGVAPGGVGAERAVGQAHGPVVAAALVRALRERLARLQQLAADVGERQVVARDQAGLVEQHRPARRGDQLAADLDERRGASCGGRRRAGTGRGRGRRSAPPPRTMRPSSGSRTSSSRACRASPARGSRYVQAALSARRPPARTCQ